MKEPMSAESRRLLETLIELAENDPQQIDWTIRFLKKFSPRCPPMGRSGTCPDPSWRPLRQRPCGSQGIRGRGWRCSPIERRNNGT